MTRQQAYFFVSAIVFVLVALFDAPRLTFR